MEEFPELQIIEKTICQICKLFKKSTKKFIILEDFELKEIKRKKKLIKPIAIRWFSLLKALLRIIEIWLPLSNALEEIQQFDPTAMGLLLTLKSFKFLFYIHYLADIMGILNSLNLAFQKNNLKLAYIVLLVDMIKSRLKEDFKDTEKLKKQDNLKNLLANINFENSSFKSKFVLFSDNLWKLLDVVIKGPFDIEFKCSHALKISKYILNDVEMRFPTLRIIENFEVFDFKKLRNISVEGEFNYKTKLGMLISFYYPTTLFGTTLKNLQISIDLQQEWKIFVETYWI